MKFISDKERLKIRNITWIHLLLVVVFLFCRNTGVLAQLTADAGPDQAVCSGLPVILGGIETAAGGSGDYSYSWTPSSTLDNPSISNPEATPFESTNYIVTVTDNVTFATDKDTVFIQLYPAPAASAYSKASETICTGGSVTVGGSPTAVGGTAPYDYLWFPSSGLDDNTSANPTASPLVTQTYVVQVVDANNCEVYSSVQIVVQSPSIVDVEPGKTVCEDEPAFEMSASLKNNTIANPAGIWSTSGTGTFDNPVDTITNYNPSTDDISNGSVVLKFTSTDTLYCPKRTDQATISFAETAFVVAGSDQSVCASNPNLSLSGSVTGGTTTGEWSTSSGKGTFTPNNTTLNATFTPHIDDITAGSVNLILTSTFNGVCSAKSDELTVTFVPLPVVAAGDDVTVCGNNANVVLNGSITGGASEGIWTTSSGKGSFTPDNTNLNATFIPHADDISAGSVLLTLTTTDHSPCNSASDNVLISFTPKPNVDAGSNQSACFNAPDVTLNGSVTDGATTGIWSSSGSGSFTPDNTDLSVSYNPSAADVTSGSVTITLTSTNNGDCIAESDFATITFINLTYVEAGSNKTVCANKPNVSLNGSVSGGTTTGIWSSSGDGVFDPNNTLLNAVYKPGTNDIANGTVKLRLSSTNNAPCTAISDSLTITIIDGPLVDAGSDIDVCSNNINIALSGSVSGPTVTGIWSTAGDGSFLPSTTNLNASYSPGAQDITDGFVNVQLTSTNNGSCLPESDNLTINIAPGPVVNAGPDQQLCSSAPDAILNGAVTGSTTTGIWTSSGTGSFNPNNTTLNATYVPSAGDISSGTITLSLTSTNNGTCTPESDAMNITITESPVVDPGTDQTKCVNNMDFQLSGLITGGTTTGIWSSSGTGTFDPSNQTLNAKYIPSADDIASGNVTLTLASTNNGGCSEESGDILLTITPAPLVDAGPDQYLSTSAPNVLLNGSVSGGSTTGIWTSTGTGSFNPDNTTLNATYIPSADDITTGSVTITLTSTNNGNCVQVSDELIAEWSPGAVVNAGPDQEVCTSESDVQLNGSVSVVTTTGIWTSSGTGFFDDSTDLSTLYHLSATDKTNGTVTFTLTSTNNGGFDPKSDDLIVTITDLPVVNAGGNDVACANVNISLNGSVSGGTTTGVWSASGDGVFLPDANQLNAEYVPGTNDQVSGAVTLYLSSTNNGGCVAFTDNKEITLNPAPVVNAGSDQTKCDNNPNTTLSGSVSGATTTGQWSSPGDGIFFPTNTALNGSYIPGSNDISSGSVWVKLQSTNNGSCNIEEDSLLITFSQSPSVDAGTDRTVCANNATTTIAGSVSGSTATGIWVSSGDGSFNPDNTSLTTDYVPGTTDETNGFADIYLTSTNNGNCNAVTDTIRINITPAPVVDAGLDQTLSTINPNVSLNGTISGGSSTGEWNSSGTGTFIPNITSLDGVYEPSSADTSAKTVTLTLTSANNGKCNPEKDQTVITYVNGPVVEAGDDQHLCITTDTLRLNGYVGGNTNTGIWSTSGTGTFDVETFLNTIYNITSEDKNNGSVVITLTSTNSDPWEPESDSFLLYIHELPIVNAGPDDTICSNDAALLTGIVTGGTTTGGWVSTGDGSFSPDTSTLDATYTPGTNDLLAGEATLYLVSTNNGGCTPATDQVTIKMDPPPIVDAGPDAEVCANNADVALNGSVSGPTTTGTWISSGDGTFAPDATTLNATYTPGLNDMANKTVTLTLHSTNNGECNEVIDDMIVTIIDAPLVNAGIDQQICANNDANLSGNVSGFTTSGIWTSSGDGSFTPNNTSLSTTYIFGTNDKLNGTVDLILTSTNNDNCFAVRDTMEILVTPEPFVNAGTDTTVCGSTPQVTLNGVVTGGSGTGKWTSSGTGIFNPSNTDLNAIYQPGPEDLVNGSVQLRLTSTNNGGCIPVTSQKIINYTKAPVVNAGEDVYVCSDNLDAPLSGSISGGTTTGFWVTEGDGSFDDVNDINSIYHIGDADSANVSVDLILTSTNNGICPAERDTVSIIVSQPSFSEAGIGDTVCANNADITLNGIVTGGTTTGIWTTDGNGVFLPDANDLNGTYRPGTQDKTAGKAILTLTSTNYGGCEPSEDSLEIMITQPPVVTAGGDLQFCETENTFTLNGSVTGGSSSGLWTSSGAGTFTPNNTDFTVTYTRDATDSIVGFVDLMLTSTNNGDCLAETDTARITFTRLPHVDAGINDSVCSNNAIVSLNGLVSGGTNTGIWTSSGSGTFTPGDTALNAVYQFSAADKSLGVISLYLGSTNNGGCLPATDTVDIVQLDAPLVEIINTDTTLCVSSPRLTLEGNVSGLTFTGKWSTSGDGTFTPNDSLLTGVEYLAGAGDIDSILYTQTTLYLTSTQNWKCNPVTDSILIRFQPLPRVYAGGNKNLCLSSSTIDLEGYAAFGSTTGIWTTTGDGSFENDTSLTTVYTPGTNDITVKEFNIILTSTNNGYCGAASDTMVVRYSAEPEISAGDSLLICENNSTIDLNAIIISDPDNTFRGIWRWYTSGSGQFSDTTVQDPRFIPSANDLADGQFYIIGSALDNYPCGTISDTLMVRVTPKPNVLAGDDISSCADNGRITLNGQVTQGATTGIWSTSGDGFFTPSDTVLNATYQFGDDDNNAGTVQLILTSTENGDCRPESDTLILSIQEAISVSAGMDITVCANNATISLNGNVSGGTNEGIWSATGSGSFVPSATEMNTSYIPGIQDTSLNEIILILTSTNNGDCAPISDSLVVSLNPAPQVFAGTDTVTSNKKIRLNGFVANAGGGIWTTSGTGIFYPSDSVLNTTYIFGTSEILTGDSVILILTSTENGDCLPVSDSIQVINVSKNIPNAFTPDDDGINDIFMAGEQIQVFNRWGQIMYEGSDGWDGRYKGQKVPSGTYFYIVTYTDENGNVRSKNGSVTLITR